MPRKTATPATPSPAVPSIRFLRHVAVGTDTYRPGDIIPVAGIPAHQLRSWLERSVAVEA